MRIRAFLLSLSFIAMPVACDADESNDRRDATPDEAGGKADGVSEFEGRCEPLAGRPWTEEEAELLLDFVVEAFVDMKRNNDALIRERGVGKYAGVRTATYNAVRTGDIDTAANLIRPHVKPGFDARAIAQEIEGTSCIGRVYEGLKAAYEKLGRADEWRVIERCGRAFDSGGLAVQRVLMASGWPGPTLGFVTDAQNLPGGSDEIAFHQTFLRSVDAGRYFGTPVSQGALLSDFLPSPGSSTPRDEVAFLALGRSRSLSFATVRGGFHVPLVVPAAAVPTDIAHEGAGRQAWLTAHERHEPFVLESHSARQPWDPTNIEIRPLREVLAETFQHRVTYATGTLLFAPHSELTVADFEEGNFEEGDFEASCESATLGTRVPSGACVQRPSDEAWFRCTDGAWTPSEGLQDATCTDHHPL